MRSKQPEILELSFCCVRRRLHPPWRVISILMNFSWVCRPASDTGSLPHLYASVLSTYMIDPDHSTCIALYGLDDAFWRQTAFSHHQFIALIFTWRFQQQWLLVFSGVVYKKETTTSANWSDLYHSDLSKKLSLYCKPTKHIKEHLAIEGQGC